jgi:hypothetical protein
MLGRTNLIKRSELERLLKFYLETYFKYDDVGNFTYMQFDSNGDLTIQSQSKEMATIKTNDIVYIPFNMPVENEKIVVECTCPDCVKHRAARYFTKQ